MAGISTETDVDRPVRRQTRKGNLQIALIGAGTQGRALASAILRVGRQFGIKFRAICDIWPYNLEAMTNKLRQIRRFGHDASAYTDWREMLDKEKLDAVLIATPDFCHATQTIACLEKGLDVYCETPMSNSLQDAKKMVLTAKRTGRLLQIGKQRRSNPRYEYCRQVILGNANVLHRITNISGQWHRGVDYCAPRGTPAGKQIAPNILKDNGYESMEQLRNWRWHKNLSAGLFASQASHQLDVYSWLLGEAMPTSVIACANSGYRSQSQWPDSTIAIFEFATPSGSVRASYETISTNSSRGIFEQFMGDQATLVISETTGQSATYREGWIKKDNPETRQEWQNWERWVDVGVVLDTEGHHLPGTKKQEKEPEGIADSRQTPTPPRYDIPAIIRYPAHLPHLKNFFDAIRGKCQLNCPPEVAWRTEVMISKVAESVELEKRIDFEPGDFIV